MKALGVAPERPRKSLKLGNPALLEMTMASAAQHFGETFKVARRDMKSGAKKRKQSEIEAERLQIAAE
ncbi:hypothetical protein D3C87_2199980 [compost metagenome]